MRTKQYTITVLEASRSAKSSVNHIVKCIEDGRLKAIRSLQKTRPVWRINNTDLKEFINRHVKGNNKVGRRYKIKDRSNIVSKGYVYIYKPDHPKAYKYNGYVAEHVLVVEQHLKRHLQDKEEVHHINGNKKDNRIENLRVYEDRSAHLKHGHGEWHRLKVTIIKQLSHGITGIKSLPDSDRLAFFDSVLAVL